MSRVTVVVDRLLALLTAGVLIAAGAAAAVWGTGQVPPLTGTIEVSLVAGATDRTWWPWAIGVGGGLLAVLGFRWLFAHIPRRGTGHLRLAGTDRTGRLLADGGPVATAAAEALEATLGVRSARGRIVRERGQVIARLNATVEPDADLALVARSADQVSAELRQVLGRDDLRCGVQIRIAGGDHPLPRVD